jgi:hypothetical protein
MLTGFFVCKVKIRKEIIMIDVLNRVTRWFLIAKPLRLSAMERRIFSRDTHLSDFAGCLDLTIGLGLYECRIWRHFYAAHKKLK